MADIDTSSGGGKHDGGKVRGKKMSTKVDMTPMVDLGFLLLTFFMFTTTFSKPNQMDLNMPNKDEDPKKEQDKAEIKESNTITIIMGKDDRVFWHQKSFKNITPDLLKETDYSREGIRKAIYFANQNALDTAMFTVVVKPTDDCNFKNVVDIMDELEITNSKRKAIVDISPEELAIYKAKVAQPKQQ